MDVHSSSGKKAAGKKRGRTKEQDPLDLAATIEELPNDWLEKRKWQMGNIEIDEDKQVRPAITDSASVSLRVRKLNADFTCPICLGIIRDATTVMECLHRFCQECIEMSIRMGRKQCPSCRTRVPTKRNLRRDVAFDALIRQIYPNIDHAVEQQDSEISSFIQSHNYKAYADSVEQGAKKQDMKRKTRIVLPPAPHRARKSDRPANTLIQNKADHRIGFSMLPNKNAQPTLPDLKRKYLRTSRLATVANLQAYLSFRLERNEVFDLYVMRRGKRRDLKREKTLEELKKQHCPDGGELELFYTLPTGTIPSS